VGPFSKANDKSYNVGTFPVCGIDSFLGLGNIGYGMLIVMHGRRLISDLFAMEMQTLARTTARLPSARRVSTALSTSRGATARQRGLLERTEAGPVLRARGRIPELLRAARERVRRADLQGGAVACG